MGKVRFDSSGGENGIGIGGTGTSNSSQNLNEFGSPEQQMAWRRLHLSKSKLSNCVEMAEIMSAFSIVVTVELQINDADADAYLLTAFVITTALLVSTSMLAVMISTCILPHIASVAKMAIISQVHQSPHDNMIRLIDLCWVLTNTVSIFFFTLDVILMCWIKFAYFSKIAAICATAIMSPILLIILIFGIVFYRKIVKHQYKVSFKKFEELEMMREQLDRDTESMTSSAAVSRHFVTGIRNTAAAVSLSSLPSTRQASLRSISSVVKIEHV